MTLKEDWNTIDDLVGRRIENRPALAYFHQRLIIMSSTCVGFELLEKLSCFPRNTLSDIDLPIGNVNFYFELAMK